MYIVIILLLILFLVPTILFALVSWILSIFGFRPKKRWHSTGRGFYYSSESPKDAHTAEPKHENRERKKIFAKDEGEYVDFEEIK